MATGVTQNVTISASSNSLTISGVGGTGILIDNTNAFTLTITAPIVVPTSQAWTNNSGNLFTVSGPTITLGNNDVITVNGTGNTLISANIGGGNPNSGLTMAGSGTLTLTGSETYGATTTVNGGTLLVNGSILNGVTVNNAGSTLGGIGTITGSVGVGAGANISPGNGGNTIGTLQTGALTLASGSNFRVDINGTTAGTFDQIQVNAGGVTINGSNLVVTVGTTLSVGQTFMILNKVSTGLITGTFAQGSTVTGSDGTVFSISYTSGTGGNDIVLTVIQAAVPEPSTWMGGALAIAGLAFTQRRRLRKLIARRCAVGS